MSGRKDSPNHGMLHGKKPAGSKDFKKGEKRTLDAAHKGGQARKAQFARIKTLREAAEALRDIPAFNRKEFPDMTNGVAAVAAMFKEAQDRNPKAFTALANLMGEMTQKIELTELPTLVDDVPRAPDPAPDASPSEGT